VLSVCLKLEATPYKHTHRCRICRGRLTASWLIASAESVLKLLQWQHQCRMPVRATKLPQLLRHVMSFSAARPGLGRAWRVQIKAVLFTLMQA